MHGGEHSNNIGPLEPTNMRGKQVKEIPWGNAGVEGVQVLETPDPSIFNYLEDEVLAYHFTGSDERLGGKAGGLFSFHLIPDFVGGIVFDAGVVQLGGANHGVEAHGCTERALVGRIGEDEYGRTASVGAEGYGVKDGAYGLAKADYIVVCQRANNGGIALLRCVEQGDDV